MLEYFKQIFFDACHRLPVHLDTTSVTCSSKLRRESTMTPKSFAERDGRISLPSSVTPKPSGTRANICGVRRSNNLVLYQQAVCATPGGNALQIFGQMFHSHDCLLDMKREIWAQLRDSWKIVDVYIKKGWQVKVWKFLQFTAVAFKSPARYKFFKSVQCRKLLVSKIWVISYISFMVANLKIVK